MFATTLQSRSKRRGIVLVLVLGMLALMALIGVTFATLAGQSLVSSRAFNQGVGRPQAETLMDYALAQLINDTNNPLSALRGHSLLRDMYGNDSVFRGAFPANNPAVETGGVLASRYINGVGDHASLVFTNHAPRVNHTPAIATPFYDKIQYQTNIPTTGPFYGLDFTRWIVKFPGNQLGNGLTTTNGLATQTFEILEDDNTNGTGFHLFTLSNNLTSPTMDPNQSGNAPLPLVAADWATFDYINPNWIDPTNGVSPANNGAYSAGPYTFNKAFARLAPEWGLNTPFVLDGRNMRAFNGPGMTASVTGANDVYPFNKAAYANFRINGLNPDFQGMDEDYDACDLENWYLALQSADGQVVVPSFHRPGILNGPNSVPAGVIDDWHVNSPSSPANNPGPYGSPKILRPRQADNSPLFPADPSMPNSDGTITYDIDNDGDGITDSVWIDLGYPVQRDPNGKLSKPLFAFMIIGLNGRLPLNTVGNLQARANADTTNNGVIPFTPPAQAPNYSGQVPQPGTNGDGTGYKQVVNNSFFTGNTPFTSSQTYFDAPLWDHASHLGYSVNEINPKFALQNAPSNIANYQSTAVQNAPNAPFNGNNYSQVDDAGVSVALTQLRNILAGTIPTDLPYPYTGGYPLTNMNNPNEKNGDVNVVIVDNKAMILPNNVADQNDINFTGNTPYAVPRSLPAVPGRWGEAYGIQLNSLLQPPSVGAFSALSYPGYVYNNPVRAGRSVISGLTGTPPTATNDIMDDDFDGTDPALQQYASAVYYYLAPGTTPTPPATTTVTQTPAITRNFPEEVDTFDTIGQRAIASERSRMFVTPTDPGGVGRVVGFMNRPVNDYDYGTGYDNRGRTSFFRYFRTPGMPQEILYPYGGNYGGNTSIYNGYSVYSPYTPGSPSASFMGQQYLMPQLFPTGMSTSAATLTSGASDINNNRYHGFQSMLTPEISTSNTPPITSQKIASMGGMPYDWDSSLTATPMGYPSAVSMGPYPYAAGSNNITLFEPTINPNTSVIFTAVNTDSGPNLGIVGNPTATPPPGLTIYPIDYGNYANNTDSQPVDSPVVNGYLGGGLNKDEADEMNLYTSNRYDMPYGPSDLEWLYRLQDVDGSTLSSRLSKLAPVSFLNPADGQTRRRLFSTDSWEPTGFVYANDNPAPYAGRAYNSQTDHDFTFNSRFSNIASPSLENMNQVAYVSGTAIMANPITTEYLPNPTFPMNHATASAAASDIYTLFPNSLSSPALSLPTPYANNPQFSVASSNNVVVPSGGNSLVQVQTPSLSHRDRKINLNMPLPISHDPAEPVRQKWCRETYQMLKAILPPASVDTPEELAALSQFVVNIIDFRDPDCAMTRFVNTDLIVTDVLTKTASNIQPNVVPTSPNLGYDTTWNVSPAGVRFATAGDGLNGHFPYDPSLYSPDATTPFLVQHGMEYNPIAINEVLAFQVQSTAGSPTAVKGMYIELVNLLTEEQNSNGHPTSTTDNQINASAISLQGWDLIIAPDNYGWGRPDPITGEVSSIAYPPMIVTTNPNPAPGTQTAALPAPNTVPGSPLTQVQNYQFTGNNNVIRAINSGQPNYYIVGTAMSGALTNEPTSTTNPPLSTTIPATFVPSLVPGPSDLPMGVGSGKGQYFWLYLRRPANPFDITTLTPNPPTGSVTSPATARPNREMVVVDAMRFPFIDAGPASSPNSSLNEIYSARRLQPYRGGHLVFPATVAGTPASTRADGSTAAAASGVTTICPPSPAYAYGYSEQMCPNSSGTITATYASGTTLPFKSSIGSEGSPRDDDGTTNHRAQWEMFPFNDRDFTSVAELLQVPGCPPGLFTKQFIEEPYPGNYVSATYTTTQVAPAPSATPPTGPITTTTTVTYPTPVTPATVPVPVYATGTDYNNSPQTPGNPMLGGNGLTGGPGTIKAPYPYMTSSMTAPPVGGTVTTTTITTTLPTGGRPNFNQLAAGTTANPGVTGTWPMAPTFPYLPDNFYYTAASVAPTHTANNVTTVALPPAPAGTLPDGMTHLPTEIGGWTGNGWHKMMEFFEVPSSANGAVGTADTLPNRANGYMGGTNFDWSRADVKPGLLNLNLIIDEEVFAGLFDDPRLNEQLAFLNSALPHIVTQVDTNGYAAASYPIFNMQSYNQINNPPASPTNLTTPGYYPNNGNIPANPQSALYGRGYTLRDPDSQNYAVPSTTPPIFPYQQVHGLKAAFSDFLKLRHGGSGFLFAYGAGPTGSGNYQGGATQPIAADRPYRSLSYPDINYTIMRPASLPPSSTSTPQLPSGLANLFTYQLNTPTANGNKTSYLALNPFVAPMNLTSNDTPAGPFQYIADPGVKNPYLSIQYINTGNPRTATTAATYPIVTPAPVSPPAPPPGTPYPGPPYPTYDPVVGQYVVQPVAATNPMPTPPPAPFPPPIPPTPARRLIQVPDVDTSTAVVPGYPSSNASLSGSVDEVTNVTTNPPNTVPHKYSVNQQVVTPMLTNGTANAYNGTAAGPPTLIPQSRSVFLPDNNTPTPSTSQFEYTNDTAANSVIVAGTNNYLGASIQTSNVNGGPPVVNPTGTPPIFVDNRQHPLYRTEMLQKIMNLTTVRTHQYAVWITVGFFEVIKPGTPELGIPDLLGQEVGLSAGKNTRYRSFFTLDRTKATGFNPYYPGNFRDCVTYRRRIE